MKELTIEVAKKPQVFTPKLNFRFYRQTRDDKELSRDNMDGFSALVNGLLDNNVDMIVAAYYHALAYYRRNQPSEADVEDALETAVFADEDTTDKEFDAILSEMKDLGFLARKLNEFVKNNEKSADLVQSRLDKMDDGERKDNLELGLQQITEQTNHLKGLLASTDSSPKPEDAGLTQPTSMN